ncbi:MAG: response regulator transcription factor [Gammaproteobacteria bacterium]
MKKPTVYIVDSDHSAREELHALLSNLDAEIQKFPSAECFLHAKRPDEFACLIANVALPGLSGLGLIEKLKERDIHLPTVLIDNIGEVSTAVRAMRAGVIDYIEKPFAAHLLLKVVSDAICSCVEKDPSGPSV